MHIKHRLFLLIILLQVDEMVYTLLTPQKTEYVIGGWIVGTPELLLKKWSPLLQTYLTDEIGPLYEPPISFKLIPVDYEANFTSPRLIEQGMLDFLCKLM
jgi:hypothetical protein